MCDAVAAVVRRRRVTVKSRNSIPPPWFTREFETVTVAPDAGANTIGAAPAGLGAPLIVWFE